MLIYTYMKNSLDGSLLFELMTKIINYCIVKRKNNIRMTDTYSIKFISAFVYRGFEVFV